MFLESKQQQKWNRKPNFPPLSHNFAEQPKTGKVNFKEKMEMGVSENLEN